MLFNSLHFLVFFPIVVFLYFRLRPQARVYWLIGASCYFYMAFVPAYILVLFFLILLDYTAGLLIARSTGRRRKLWLVTSLAGNIGVLGVFKYAAFLDANVGVLARAIGFDYAPFALRILLPIGLSFHTFQSMAYIIEVYRGRYPAERHLGVYALYVLFFPQMVAGPIERPQNLLAQLHWSRPYDHDRVVSGVLIMLVGFFKKVVIADRFAVVVNGIYGDPAAHSGTALLLATYCFAIQIYCDFSGYSDIAIGAARVMGYDLMPNFNRPYAATSVPEFWKRWHISLSTWFRDYLYIPLGGRREGRGRWYANLLIVFIVSGLWHGAAWTFAAWGALHGTYLVASYVTEPWRARLRRVSGVERCPRLLHTARVVTTFHLVAIGWVFFRAGSIGDAAVIVTRMHAEALRGGMTLAELGLTPFDFLVGVAALLGLQLYERGTSRRELPAWIRARPVWVRWPAYYALVSVVLLLGKFGAQEFIYFQF